MNSFAAGQYYPGNSFLHRLDPRTKLIALFGYYIFLVCAKDFFTFLAAAVLGAVWVGLSGVPLRLYFRALRVLLLILVLAAVFACFFTAGTAFWRLGPVAMSREGAVVGATLVVRFGLAFFAALALTFTTTPLAITAALAKLFGPLGKLGVPVADLAMTMSLALRFIPVMLREAETTRLAQQSRGLDFSTGPLSRRFLNMIPLLLPLFVAAFRRADELAWAMAARGYRGDVSRTSFHPLAFGLRDVVVITVALLSLLLLVFHGWFL